jgi:hypothetical protein
MKKSQCGRLMMTATKKRASRADEADRAGGKQGFPVRGAEAAAHPPLAGVRPAMVVCGVT